MHDKYERYVYARLNVAICIVYARTFIFMKETTPQQQTKIVYFIIICLNVFRNIFVEKQKPKIFNWPISRDFVHHSLNVLVIHIFAQATPQRHQIVNRYIFKFNCVWQIN